MLTGNDQRIFLNLYTATQDETSCIQAQQQPKMKISSFLCTGWLEHLFKKSFSGISSPAWIV